MRRPMPKSAAAIALALALSLPAGVAFTAERVVLLEMFTNTG